MAEQGGSSEGGEMGRCPLCDPGEVLVSNALAIALSDHFPVNPGHVLVAPRRHVETWFEALRKERIAIIDLIDDVKAILDKDVCPDGYNIGVNIGHAGGQTIFHLHLHVIPRFKGDVDDPTGGVRMVIPQRGNYRRSGFVPTALPSRRSC